MRTITLDPCRDASWAALVASGRSSVFASPPWMSAIAETYGFDLRAVAVTGDDGMPRAGLAYADVSDLCGRRLVSLPFCDYLDPVVDSRADWDALVEPLLEQDAAVRLRVLDSDIPRVDDRFDGAGELAWHSTRIVDDDQTLFERIDARGRRNIRAAQRNGVSIRFGSALSDVYELRDLHCRTRKQKYRLLPQPDAFFDNVWKNFAPFDGIVVGTALYEGAVIAASLYLLWDDTIFYKFGASDETHLAVRPNDLLAWESMRLARDRGCRRYDWGVSDLDQPGLVAYKRKFATTERRVSVLRHTPHPPESGAIEAGALLTQLTELFTGDDVTDAVTRQAGNLLYRYFA